MVEFIASMVVIALIYVAATVVVALIAGGLLKARQVLYRRSNKKTV